MKKTIFIFVPFSILANAAFLGLGIECLLDLLGLAMAVSLDGSLKYPRFVPFCIILGIVALLGLIAMLIINVTASKKLNFKKSVWVFEYIFALVLALPVTWLWEMLFDFLQKAF